MQNKMREEIIAQSTSPRENRGRGRKVHKHRFRKHLMLVQQLVANVAW